MIPAIGALGAAPQVRELINNLVGKVLSSLGGLVKTKRQRATALPEDYESHGYRKNFETTVREFYGLKLSDSEIEGLFVGQYVPLQAATEDRHGGRHAVKADTPQHREVIHVPSHAFHVLLAKLRIAGAGTIGGVQAPYDGSNGPAPTWLWPTDSNAGINEYGVKVPLSEAKKLAENMQRKLAGKPVEIESVNTPGAARGGGAIILAVAAALLSR